MEKKMASIFGKMTMFLESILLEGDDELGRESSDNRSLAPALAGRKLKDEELENLWRILQGSYLVISIALGKPSPSFNEKVEVNGEQIDTEWVTNFLRGKFDEYLAKPTISVVYNAQRLNIALNDLNLESFGAEKFLPILRFDVDRFNMEFGERITVEANPLLKEVWGKIGQYVTKNKKPGFESLGPSDVINLVFTQVLRPSEINAIARSFITNSNRISIMAIGNEDINSGTVLTVTFTKEE